MWNKRDWIDAIADGSTDQQVIETLRRNAEEAMREADIMQRERDELKERIVQLSDRIAHLEALLKTYL